VRSLLVVALACSATSVACGRSERKAEPAPKPTTPADAAAATPDAPAAAGVITQANRQLLVGIIPDWSSTTAELRLWTRDIGGPWRIAMDTWPAVIGTSGAAWGNGMHGNGVPNGRSGDVKREGDGKSPAGVFAIRDLYGYAATAPTTDLVYQGINENWKCIDDPASKAYNLIIDKRTMPNDWKSAEDMRRKDALYTWVVDIAHNAERKPGDGSCIFLHVWRDAKGATVGCTAMEQSKLEELASKLAPIMRPAYVLLPRAEYDALAPAWGLPAP
jgi:L,D-peptidoglycan transpeptidase YkuD (ErfK/YbiS/YcfS/YnhG family)